MMIHFLFFLLSLIALSKGADLFVEHSAKLAKRMGVSDLVIGLTLTSVGTSLPELASSISASFNGASELIMGNIVGSNIANIGLILGVSAFIKAIPTDEKMHDRDGLIMMACTSLFFAFILNNQISTWQASVLFALYILYLYFVVISSAQERAYHFRDFMKFVFDFEYIEPVKKQVSEKLLHRKNSEGPSTHSSPPQGEKSKWIRDSLWILFSATLLILGAKYLIQEALWLAHLLQIPENIVGLTMIAVGTSLPELMVSVAAVRKNKGGLVVGNIIGSNIANILLIGGISGLISPLHVAEKTVTMTVPILLFFSLFLLYSVKSDQRITRLQGGLLLMAYLAFIVRALS